MKQIAQGLPQTCEADARPDKAGWLMRTSIRPYFDQINRVRVPVMSIHREGTR